MIIFTYYPGKKSFLISLCLLFTGLIILKISSVNNPGMMPVKDGQSVATLKNLYSAFSKKNHIEVKTESQTFEEKKLTALDENTFKTVLNVVHP